MTERSSKWTHPSVVALASRGDPVDAVTTMARLLVWEAAEQGWKGPPFDPFQLAELRGIKTIPREDIRDARIVPLGSNRLAIEFNPTRPRSRVRYSLAHELAHTLFPDCGDKIRNRAHCKQMSGDEWQLEMLCNVAASEILMPTGSFPELADENDLSIAHLMELRSQFDVSAEALLHRVTKLTSRPCFMFATSRIDDSSVKSPHKIDYSISGRTCAQLPSRGTVLPGDSLLGDCTGVGFTSHGVEVWPAEVGRVRLECVGIPPFPGRVFPRVVGIGRKTTGASLNRPNIKYVTGDATQPHGSAEGMIVFVVNDTAALWGAGFARVIRKKWPDVQQSFRKWTNERSDRLKLGQVYFSDPTDGTSVAAMVAQHGYGPSPTPRIRYSALEQCLKAVTSAALERNAVVHMPRIACGEARGDWRIVSELINETLCREGVPVTVYDLPGSSEPRHDRASAKNELFM